MQDENTMMELLRRIPGEYNDYRFTEFSRSIPGRWRITNAWRETLIKASRISSNKFFFKMDNTLMNPSSSSFERVGIRLRKSATTFREPGIYDGTMENS